MENTFLQVNRRIIITSILLMLAGLTYASFSVYSIISTRKFMETAPTAEVEVINVTRKRSGQSDGNKTRVYVTYTVGEEEYAYVHVANAPSSTRKGDMITIHYDPENPGRITAADQSYTRRLMGIIIGLLMTGLGIRRVIKIKKA